ncbi:MAG: hypothetical protein D6762_09280, partial [Candidatus Neomarinimicrobiota bacterium]
SDQQKSASDQQKDQSGQPSSASTNSQPQPAAADSSADRQNQINAAAILDALKQEEKINRQRKEIRARSRKLEKDW